MTELKLGEKCPKCKGSGLSNHTDQVWVMAYEQFISRRIMCNHCKGTGVKP